MTRNNQPPTSPAGYTDILHPVTKRFMFALDAQRGLARVSDRGIVVAIDLAEYGWRPVHDTMDACAGAERERTAG
jgi:hypothetical protein